MFMHDYEYEWVYLYPCINKYAHSDKNNNNPNKFPNLNSNNKYLLSNQGHRFRFT